MSNKHNYSSGNKFDLKSKVKDIHIGEVVSVEDSTDMGRIKIRIKGEDDAITNVNDLPWCFPMIPKYLGITPQIGEAVLVFIWDKDLKYSDRLYIGPIISQLQNLEYDPYYFSAQAGFSFGVQTPKIAHSTIPTAKGVFGNKKDIVLQGRENTDLIFKKNEVLLRAGKFVKKNKKEKNQISNNEVEKNGLNFEFNVNTQGYIQIKYDAILSNENNKEERGSVTNIVANKINLLTHVNSSPRFNVTNQDNLISDEELIKINKEAHPLVFGDVIAQWMILAENAILNHWHNGSTPTDLTGAGQKMPISEFKQKASQLRSQMLSHNIKIN